MQATSLGTCAAGRTLPVKQSTSPSPRKPNAVASRRIRSRLLARALLLGTFSPFPFAAAQGQTPTVSLSVSPNPVTVTLSAVPASRVFIPLRGGTAESATTCRFR